MDELHEWIRVAAACVAAVGLFMLGMGSRYAPFPGDKYPIALDRWTGHLVARGFSGAETDMHAYGFEKLLKELKLQGPVPPNITASGRQENPETNTPQ